MAKKRGDFSIARAESRGEKEEDRGTALERRGTPLQDARLRPNLLGDVGSKSDVIGVATANVVVATTTAPDPGPQNRHSI